MEVLRMALRKSKNRSQNRKLYCAQGLQAWSGCCMASNTAGRTRLLSAFGDSGFHFRIQQGSDFLDQPPVNERFGFVLVTARQ
jgi:hypothetical protein